jgi:hypothetical protein
VVVLAIQLWGPELFLAGYNTPAVWEMCNLQAAQRWQCPCSKGAGVTISCLDASRIDVVQLYDTGSARVAARLDATALRRSAASLPWQAAGRHDTVVTRHRRRHATAASSDLICVPFGGAPVGASADSTDAQRERRHVHDEHRAAGGSTTTLSIATAELKSDGDLHMLLGNDGSSSRVLLSIPSLAAATSAASLSATDATTSFKTRLAATSNTPTAS